jgi:predicted nucleic acid-binding protein
VSDRWIVNASPVIVLAKIGRLSLLSHLCKELLVPKAVAAEILAGSAVPGYGKSSRHRK